MNKLIKGITDDGLDNILDLLVISFNNYYGGDVYMDRNDFEISEVLYSNSDMNSIYNLHLSIKMLNHTINTPQIKEIIITTNSISLEATCKVHFSNPSIVDDYFYFVFDIEKDDEWFEYY